jgi:carbon-monoxide dehydrogenase small subunit
VNGRAVKSCTTFAWQLEGANVLTIEGLAEANAPLHPMQEAFREHHGLQCGYCTPGMIMSAIDIVNRKGNELDEHTIRHELEGNICRCTGYHNIVKAIAAGAKTMGGGSAGRQAAE